MNQNSSKLPDINSKPVLKSNNIILESSNKNSSIPLPQTITNKDKSQINKPIDTKQSNFNNINNNIINTNNNINKDNSDQ